VTITGAIDEVVESASSEHVVCRAGWARPAHHGTATLPRPIGRGSVAMIVHAGLSHRPATICSLAVRV